MTKRDYLTVTDFTKEETLELIDEAIKLKHERKSGINHDDLSGKTLGMIFEKSSTRTRVSFEAGMMQLGGHALFLSHRDIQLGRGESIHDTANVLSRYVDGLMIRTFAHSGIEEFAHYAEVPIINGLTDEHHPCQVLADLMTIREEKGDLTGLTMCFIGDGYNNMTHSLMEGAALMGMNMHVASPEGYEPSADITNKVHSLHETNGGSFQFSHDPAAAITDADVILTDVWASMGNETEEAERIEKFAEYQVNVALVSSAAPNYMFLHCLPAHRGEEVSASIIDGPRSFVFEEAENRMHAQKALLKKLL
ncbi:ornithine carbamoyltransferase [Salisediminibacterium halotolerans]|uniref:ornithine carbamoyltransferase n=1 Tax=Salisediminibacterium halotolerans TaxID=517425 RepID=UPI000EB4A2ED|nr:ornithine carbamoyltransferase [Salisediminibacterium halotolerans]RLJ81032.1 ornithine carbamoyltransferase [Actinophytocola xinjiangensis]RPE87878.1 ornithine carbamoyltransferase [Salisediminibacterium halotolerans]TWG37925.1 ornithine carbamoyltransferase [Salisediminibacterium halotolerans]GEL08250.1 ornithine carbamoyltransferase [Salisediminibacterium halotolerans]